MKMLQWHCEYFRYKATRLALKTDIDPAPEGAQEFKNVIVAMVSVEKQDTPETGRTAITLLKKHMDEVKADSILIYPYAHLSKNLSTPAIAVTILKEMEMFAKSKNISASKAPFGHYKEFEVKVKGHPLAELSKSL